MRLPSVIVTRLITQMVTQLVTPLAILLAVAMPLSAAVAADAASPAGNSRPNANTILVLGDSLSAAYGLSTGQGWVDLLQQRLHSVGNNATLVNASISGTTSSTTLNRLDGLLQQHRPTICIIELGANDGLRGQSLQQLEDNLRAILHGCRQRQALTLLLGMRLPPNYGRRYTDGFADIYQRLGNKVADASLPFFLDGIAQQDSLMQADRLHPTAAAQPQLMEAVWRQLRPLLQQPTNTPATTPINTPAPRNVLTTPTP